MKDNVQRRVERIYAKVSEKHPEVTNPRVLMLIAEARIRRMRFFRVALIFLLAPVCFLVGLSLVTLDNSLAQSLGGILIPGFSIPILIGVFRFIKVVQNPLTDDEEAALFSLLPVMRDEQNAHDLNAHAYKQYNAWRQEKYLQSAPPKKLLILWTRIPLFVHLFIFVLLVLGIFSTAQGIENINTFEERNRNAVEITAYISHFESFRDSDGDVYEMPYWTYTYGGKEYTFQGSYYSSSMRIGDADTFLIDSVNPETVIHNDGATDIIIGCALALVGILILVYSLFGVRDIDNEFSVFNLFWMIFAAGAIGFLIGGILFLISGEILGGILMPAVGSTIFGFIAYGAFRVTHERKPSADPKKGRAS